MNVVAWWQRRVRESHDDPRLAGALLDRRYLRYALRRLRGFAIARAAGAGLYVLEVAVLLRVMPVHTAIFALLAAHASGLLTGLWWGATEVQRRAIRESPQDADRITATWLWWARLFGTAVLACTIGLAASWRNEPVVAAYTLVLGVRVATELVLRVWHSRIAARNRLYRAMWLQLLVEATGPVLVLLLADHLAAWGFLLAMLGSLLVSRAVTYLFIRRAYRVRNRPWIERGRRFLAIPWPRALGLAASGLATRIPNLVGVLFLVMPGLPITAAIGLNMTVGMLSAAGGWAWTHYVDFLAVTGPAFRVIRGRLERLVIGEAIVVGLVVGVLAVVIVHLFAPRTLVIDEPGVVVLIPPKLPDPRPYAVALPALAVGLSVLAAAQMIAWMRGAFAAIVASALVATAGLRYAEPIVRLVVAPHEGEVPASTVRVEHAWMALVVLACGLALWRVARRRRDRASPHLPWEVAQLRAVAQPESVVAVTLARSGGVAHAFARALERGGARWWSRRGRAWLVAGIKPDAMRLVALECAGMVTSIGPFRPAEPPVPTTNTYRLRFDRRADSHRDLTEHQLHQIWHALRLRLGGGPSGRAVKITAIEVEGDAVVGLTARFARKR